METVKHLPLTAKLVPDCNTEVWQIKDAEGTLVAYIGLKHTALKELIITASNNHEDLIDACEGMIDLFKAWQNGIFKKTGVQWTDLPPAISKTVTVIAALTKFRGNILPVAGTPKLGEQRTIAKGK